MKGLDILVAGVGGQGTILASDILAEVGMLAGYDVKKSDVLGLAVRGGSVLSHVRWGEEVASPVISPGTATFLLGFEPLEALRVISYLSPESTVLVNTRAVPPVSVSSGNMDYPSLEEIERTLRADCRRFFSFDATAVAEKLGTARVANVVMLGAFATQVDIPQVIWEDAISARVPAKYRDLNLRAFHAGRELLKGGL